MVELQRQTTVDKVEIDRLRQKLAALEERLDREAEERAAAAARASAPRGLREENVPAPRRVEVIEVSDLEEPLDEAIQEESQAASGPASTLSTGAVRPEPAPPAGTESAPAGGPSVATTIITPAAQALYDQGYSLYHQGRYTDAEETFHRFLAAYARTDLGDNARYWIGECRLARNELQGALDAFRETVREYPDGNKTPDALLRAGEVLERLGDADGARASYREVERRFPESAASAEASGRLERL
ncbi:MAG TPA: tol-pal system protein YbgF [Thermoanaerobaculia bacterium]|nr:tol-pal system protein YbgF [Thermoanaerobaculia bacterium]